RRWSTSRRSRPWATPARGRSTISTTTSAAPSTCCRPCARTAATGSCSARRRPSTAIPTGCRCARTRRCGSPIPTAAPAWRCTSDPGFHAVNLRYFNPVGAHPSGLIGEAPGGVPDNLMPYVCQVAVGRRERLSVFGGDWPTVDGTGVRDYIHVVDLARAHADALDFIVREQRGATLNLGTGRGTSVLELVKAFERASGREVPYEIVGRRPGDVAEVYADPSLAQAMLGWRAEHDIDAMCRDAWRWQSANPLGYEDGEPGGSGPGPSRDGCTGP